MSVDFKLSIDDDIDYFDGLITITGTDRETGDSADYENVVRREIRTHEIAASNGKYQSGDTRFHVKDDEWADPDLGDTITDDRGDDYTIIEKRRDTLVTRWRLIARNLAISLDLDTLVTIQKAAYTFSPAGYQTANWADYKTNVRAHKQPIDADDTIEEDARQVKPRYEFTLQDWERLGNNHRLLHDGCLYRVTGWRDPEMIDRLPVVEAEDWNKPKPA